MKGNARRGGGNALRRELKSFRHAVAGIAEACRAEPHMRFHVAAVVLVVAAGLWLEIGRSDWLWVAAAVAAVLIAELFNTAIERTVDLASPDHHPLAKAAKDTAAGAVLIASLFAAIVGVAVLGPKLWDVLKGMT